MMFVTRAVYSATTRIDCFMSRQLKRSARMETRVLSPANKRREHACALPRLSRNETGAFGESRIKWLSECDASSHRFHGLQQSQFTRRYANGAPSLEQHTISKGDDAKDRVKACARGGFKDNFLVSDRGALRCRSISCCTCCLYLDPCANGYPGGQRRTDCRRSRAWCCASAWLSSLGHARAFRIARALRKRRGADQFFVGSFRGACLRGAHSRCGRVRDHHFICGDREEKRCATEKKQGRFRHQPSFDLGAGTGCGLVHDLFSDPLVVRNDHRGLHFKHATDPDCLDRKSVV